MDVSVGYHEVLREAVLHDCLLNVRCRGIEPAFVSRRQAPIPVRRGFERISTPPGRLVTP